MDLLTLALAKKAFVLVSPNGKKFKLAIDDNGVVSTVEIKEETLGFPIRWNTMEVMGNASFALGGETSMIKISNYTPSLDELSNTTVMAPDPENGIMLVYSYAAQYSVDMGDFCVAEYGGRYNLQEYAFYAISVKKAGEYPDLGLTIPEAGLYVMNYGLLGINADASIDLVSSEPETLAPGLYEPGAIALYQSGDVAGASAMLKTSWEDLVTNGVIAISEGVKLPDGLVQNEYGFYYGMPYSMFMDGMTTKITFNEDGSVILNNAGEIMELPAGTAIYGDHSIDMTAMDIPVFMVSADGTVIEAEAFTLNLEILDLPEMNEYGFYFGVLYSATMEGITVGLTFNEDSSVIIQTGNEVSEIPAGAIVYGDHSIDMSALDMPVLVVSPDGTMIDLEGTTLSVGSSSVPPKGAVYLPNNICIEGDLVLPNDGGASVTSIADSAFSGCSSLTSVVMPASVTSIYGYAFQNCSSLTSVVIPNSVTSIGGYAFDGCSSLVSAVIPNSVTSTGFGVFQNCSKLESIVIPDSVTSIDNGAFYGCSGLTSINIPNSVTNIGNGAFYRCSGLTSVVIPDSVTSIGVWAFEDCDSLTSVVIGNGVTSIDRDVFSGCSKLESIVIPNNVTNIGETAFKGCSSLTSAVIGSGVTSIDNGAFYGCSGLTSAVIGNGVTNIGGSAFYGCSGLTSVVIPDSVTSIGSGAFSGCSKLEGIVIPDGVTSIGVSAFQNCSSLTTINIPDGVTFIGDTTFYGCSSLTSAVIGNGVTTIGYNAFSGCSGLTSINIPNSVTSIGKAAFFRCSKLESVVIPDSVTSIADSAFSGCSKLANIEFEGTTAQWNAITKGNWWNYNAPATYVQCTDGQVAI